MQMFRTRMNKIKYTITKMSLIKNQWMCCILLTANCLLATAQNFPVQVIPQVTPPAPIFFSSYADETLINGPLRLQLVLNDFEIANREVRIRASVEGNGISFQSNDIVVGAAQLFLEGGIPVVLTHSDLAPYFRFENITGISPNVYGQPIPEGGYLFCYEVFDVLTNSRLSEKTCANTVIFQNEPPFLVTPYDQTNQEERNPQNIVFQWTPRSINVTNVEYEFSLVEIRDGQVDPQQAFLSSPPIFQTTTSSTTFVYGPAEPQLLSNYNYAWRVQAKAKQGAEEIGLFKNQGFSEIFSFSFAGSCDVPTGLGSEVKGSTNANVFWEDFSTDVPEYTVRYRKKASDGETNEWFTSKTSTNQLTLWDLTPGTTYEYQLQKKCVITDSDWSLVKEFMTFLEDNEDSVYECGIAPDFNLENQDPLDNMSVGDKFVAGDFPVTAQTVSGSNGRFTGEGYVTIPYLESVKVGVKFTNVLINTDKQLIEGEVITMYDPSLSNILDIDDAIDTIDNITDAFGELIEGANDLDEIRVNWILNVPDDIEIVDGILIITNPENGATVSEPLGDDKVIVDGGGNVYHVDAEGNITAGGQIDPGGAVNSDNVNGVSNDGGLESLTAEGILVTFNTPGTFGFDQMPSNANQNLKDAYASTTDFSGNAYVLAHHAVKKGAETQVTATITLSNSTYTAADVIFKTKQGEVIPKTVSGNTVTLTLKGTYSFENVLIYAVVPSTEDTDKQLTAGAFVLWHLTDRPIDVVLVSVNGASLGNITSTVQNIFDKGVASINFGTTLPLTFAKENLGADEKLEVGESAWAAAYNDEQKLLINAVKGLPGYDANTYYVLVFNDIQPSRSIAGFMPLQRQMGFVFDGSGDEEGKGGDKGKVLAHELGHGLFALQHPFSQYSSPEGSTDWLMDYSSGTSLPHMHWAQMHNPALKYYIFQDEEDGEIANKTWFTPNWEPFTVGNSSNTILTIKSQHVNGTVWGFKLIDNYDTRYKATLRNDGKYEYALYSSNSTSALPVYPIERIQLNEDDTIYLFDSSGECNKRWEAKYKPGVTGFDNYTPYTLSPPHEYPCENCEKGQEFIANYESITDEAIQSAIQEIAALLCQDNAYQNFIDALTQEGVADMLAWQQIDYFDGYGDQSLEAFNEFRRVLEHYIFFYEASKLIIATSDDREIVLKLAYNLSTTQMQALPIADKLKMLQIIATGHLSGYWTSINYNTEAIALKVINSVQEDEALDFINGISGENYAISGTMLYQVLYDKIDDFFGSSNFTTIAHKFNNLALKAKGLDYDSLTNEQIEQTAAGNSFVWDVENADYWIVNFVVDKNPIITTKIENTFTLKQTCTRYLKAGYDPYGSSPPVCEEYDKDVSGLAPFDLVSINIIEDINITQSSAYPFDYAINGKTTLVPVSFIQYLQIKKSNQQLTNFAFNTLTIASIYLSGAEIIAAKGVTTLAARLAVADLFITFSDPYFSNPELFRAHATSIFTETFGMKQTEAEELATALQLAWTVASTAATINTAADAITPQKQLDAFATYKALVNKVGETKAKQIISSDLTKGNKITQNFEAFEEDLISNPTLKSQLDQRVDEIENSDVFKLLDKASIKTLLGDDVLILTSGWDDDVLDLFFNDLLDTQYGSDLINAFNENPELVNAWNIVSKHNDDIRLNPEFLSNLTKNVDDFPNLKPDLDDIDVFNAYKQIADDVEQSYEILDDVEGNLAILVAEKTQNSKAPNFWKWIQRGKKFEEDIVLPKLKNRSSAEYTQLKNKADIEFGVNLDEFDLYSQVQLKYSGSDYFVADQVYVKWIEINGQQVIDDIVIVENKLKSTTRLTKNQNAGKASLNLEVRSVNRLPESAVSGNNLNNQLPPINTNNKWLKVYDSENGDVISGIDKL